MVKYYLGCAELKKNDFEINFIFSILLCYYCHWEKINTSAAETAFLLNFIALMHACK